MATPEQIKIRIQAQDDASPVLKATKANIDSVGTSAAKTAASARVMSSSFGGLGRNAGMAGIQVQQLVGQIQMGTNPMVALSQQATDLGFVLGVPLLGAITGIAASFGAVLLPSLLETTRAFDEQFKEIMDLAAGYADLTEAERAYIEANLQNQIAEQILAVSKLQAEVDNLTTSYGEATQAQIQFETYSEQTTSEQKAADEAAIQLNKDLSVQKRRLEDLEETLKNVQNPLREFTAEMETISKRIEPMRVAQFSYLAGSIPLWEKQTEAVNYAKTAQEAALGSMESGLQGLIMQTKSVKDAFRDMAASIISDLAKVYIRQAVTKPLAAAFGLSFDGGGYTGMGSRSGGIDGKGGFPAILHPNETVVDHTKGQSVGGGAPVTVNVNVSTGVSQTVRAEIMTLLPQITNAAQSAIIDARRRGGSVGKALA